MGVKDLKGELPWKHLRDWAVSFPGQVFLIDVANILFWCALACYPSFSAGDVIPALAEFHKFAQYLAARKVAMEMFFDGMPNPDKAYEKRRRDEKRRVAMENIASAREEGVEPAEKDKQALVTNTSMCIAMCAKCCLVLQIPFSVCYQEADSGLAARFLIWRALPSVSSPLASRPPSVICDCPCLAVRWLAWRLCADDRRRRWRLLPCASRPVALPWCVPPPLCSCCLGLRVHGARPARAWVALLVSACALLPLALVPAARCLRSARAPIRFVATRLTPALCYLRLRSLAVLAFVRR